jgi:hypothetical protein
MIENDMADIARLREIAEEGRRLPLLGGRHMVLWGCLVALAALSHAAIIVRVVAWPAESLALIWFGLMGVAALISRTKGFNRHKPAQSSDLGNRLERVVWQIGGLVLGLTSIAILAVAYLRLNQTGRSDFFILFAMMAPLTFAVYGMALRVSAEAGGIDILKPYAHLSLAFVPVTIMTAGSHWQLVSMAIGVVLVSIIPGKMLMSLEKDGAHG